MAAEADGGLARAELDLQRARVNVARSLSALEHGLARTFDWREWIRRKPGLSLGLAFGLGLFLGRRKD